MSDARLVLWVRVLVVFMFAHIPIIALLPRLFDHAACVSTVLLAVLVVGLALLARR